MTDTSPAAELRAAAERIRTLAVDADDARPDWHDHLAPHALAVARQILGSQR